MYNNSPDVRYKPDVRYMPDVQYMPSVQYMKSVNYMPSVNYGPTQRGLLQTPYRSVEDTSTKIDTLLDVILPWESEGREQLIRNTPWLEWYVDSIESPLLDYLIAPIVITYNNTLEPIVHAVTDPTYGAGDAAKDIFFNALNELGEDADILSNPVKSQVNMSEGYDGGGFEEFKKSIGWGTPRKKYNINSGNTAADIVMEIMVDPMTYISIATALVEGAGKAGISATIKGTLAKAGTELSDDAIDLLTDTIVKGLAKSKVDDEFAEEVLSILSKETTNGISEAAVKTAIKEAATEATLTNGYRAYKAASTIKSIDEGWTKISQWSTVVGPISLLKPITSKLIKAFYSDIVAMLKDTDLAKYFATRSNTYNDIAGSIIAKNNAAYKTEFDYYDDIFFKKFKTNPTKLQQDILEELAKKQVFDENFDMATDFMNILSSKYEPYKNLLTTDEDLKKLIYVDFEKKVYTDEFKNLVEELYTGPIAIDSAHRYTKQIRLQGSGKSIKKFLSGNEEDIISKYKQLDDFLMYDGVHYGLNDLDSYLKLLMSNPNVSREYVENIIDVLESYGINRTNASDISKILKSTSRKKDVALKELLEKTRGIKILEDTHYTKRMNKLENKINDKMGSEINKFFTEDLPSNARVDFNKYINEPISNMKTAVKKINSNEDIERATTYIQSFIRSESQKGLPEASTLEKQYKVAMDNIINDVRDSEARGAKSRFAHYSIDTDKYEKTIKYLKQTERIMTNLDKDASVIADIPTWYSELKPMIKDLNDFRANLLEGSYATVQLRGSVDKLIDSLNAFTNETFVENITNYMTDANNMYVRMQSHFGEFNVLMQHTHMSDNPVMKETLNLLSNKDSIYRTKIIPDILAQIEDQAPAYTKNIKTVLAQIDTVNNLATVLDADIIVPFELTNKTKDELRNILFDKIDNNRFVLISEILAQDSMLVDEIPFKYLSDTQIEKRISWRDLIKEQIAETIENTEPIRNEIKEQLEKQGVTYEVGKQQLLDNLNQKLDDYITMQNQIGASLNVDNISLATLYSKDTLDVIQTIASMETKFDFARALENNVNLNTKMKSEIISEYDTLVQDFNLLAQNMNEGLEEIAKLDNKLRVPMSRYELMRNLSKVSEQHNLYSASMESNLYTTKRIVDSAHSQTLVHGDIYKITNSQIVSTPDEYALLSDNLKIYRDYLFNDFEYDAKYIEGLRKSLIETYSRNTALFRPVNPLEYFNKFDISTLEGKQAILGWAAFTSGAAGINNKSAFTVAKRKYITQQKYLDKLSTFDILGEVQEVYRNAPIVDNEAIAHLASRARGLNAKELVNRYVEANFLTTLHNLDDLGRNKDKVVWYLKKDVAVFKDISDETIAIENMPELKKDLGGFKTKQDLADFANVSYGYETNLNKPLVQAYVERHSSLASYIGSLDSEELAAFIYNYTEGAMVFHNADIVATKHIDGSITYEPMTDIFNFSKKQLKDSGIDMKKVTNEQGDWYYFRLLDRREHENILKLKEPALNTGNRELQERVTNLIDKYKTRLNLYGEDYIPSNLLTVETLNQDTWNTFLKANEDFFGTVEEQNLYLNRNENGISRFFSGSYERVNLSVIGGYNTYNTWNMAYSDNFIPHSLSLTSNTFSGLTALVNRSNKINKYLSLVYNKDWSLAESPLLVKMFEDASDDQIKKFFAKEEYTVALLKSDIHGLPKVYEYTVTNRRTLDKAAKAGGILVPRETFSAMRKIVNRREMTNDLLDVYRRIVPSTYKSMYLFTAGFPFRNAIDSLLYKNINEEGLGVLKYEGEAVRALKLHDQIQREALAEAGDSTFGKEQLLKVLSNHTQDEIDVYYLTDLFITSPASGGLSKSLSEYLEEYNKSHLDDIRWLWERVYEDKILFGEQPYNPLYWTRNLNDHIEQTARMGLFLASVDKGYPVNEAIKRVVKTHFDYNSQHDLIDICEKIFWFSTFPINNFNYYVSGGLSRNPQLYRFLLDTQTASWNNGEYTYEELKKTKFLSYHAMVGNLRIGNYIIKINPSVFDFLNLISDPIGNIKDRVNPFIATATGLIEQEDIPEELLPWQTQLRNAAKIYKAFKGEPDGSWIPSIYSKINDYSYTRAAGRWRLYTKSTTPVYTKYPKIRKPHAYTAYVRHYYAKRYRTDVRKFTRTRIKNSDSKFIRLSRRRGPTFFESIWT